MYPIPVRTAARVRPVARGLALASLLLPLAAVESPARIRDNYTATPKAYLYVIADSLELAWNGDQGESGRGNGEVYLFTMVSWKAAVEREDPQRSDPPFGPLGGSGGVQSDRLPGKARSGRFSPPAQSVTTGLADGRPTLSRLTARC